MSKSVRFASAAMQGGWTAIPNVVLLSNTLSPVAKIVYTMLIYYAREDEECWPGQVKLAESLGMSERTLRDHIKELVEDRWIETKQRGRGQTNMYLVLGIESRPADIAGLKTRPEDIAGLDRKNLPVLGEQDSEEEKTTPRTDVVRAREALAQDILRAFAVKSGSVWSGAKMVEMIVARIEEHPELSIEDHGRIIEAAFADPWWSEPNPTPFVIYGKSRIFETRIAKTHKRDPLKQHMDKWRERQERWAEEDARDAS